MRKQSIAVGLLLITIVGALVALAFVAPRYRLYKQDLIGQANLKQQTWEKKIIIEEAKAKEEQATYNAKAEVARARGVAEANEIIGSSLENNDEYLQYLWINALYEETNSIIYIPTEANLPILEANRN